MSFSLAVIIPVLNEEKILKQQKEYFFGLSQKLVLIFVDGGSTDSTVKLSSQYGQVFQTDQGRAHQKNFGVKNINADYLLFTHVDTELSLQSLNNVKEVFSSGCVGGCFSIRINDQNKVFRLYEYILNFRAKYMKVIDGDMGVFVDRNTFKLLNGFDESLPIMDDIEFSKRLRKCGDIKVLSDVMKVSSRKWRNEGFITTLIQYTLAYIQHWIGIPFYKKKKIVRA